jgi:hypothetical protein
MCEFSELPKNGIVNALNLILDNGETTNFNLLLSFFDQVTSCNATRPNRPHQNKRKQPAIMDCTHTVEKALSTHISIDLM